MHGCKVTKKDGTEILGTLWALNRTSWCFEVIDDVAGRIDVPVSECHSAVEYGGRETLGTAGEDVDLMAKARKWGWTG